MDDESLPAEWPMHHTTIAAPFPQSGDHTHFRRRAAGSPNPPPIRFSNQYGVPEFHQSGWFAWLILP